MAEVKAGPNRPLVGGPQSGLERKLIAEYLLSEGYLMSDLRDLPEQKAQSLMKKACIYAALKLAEIESRARLRRGIER
jgi:hypothetical protein